MGDLWKNVLWQQFGATIDMLDNALSACPAAEWEAALWKDRSGLSDFWYVAYHTLFWLDLYLSGAVEGFSPPEPFDLAELDPAGLLPSRLNMYLGQAAGWGSRWLERPTPYAGML